ncbi:unnamed protein product [Polarella glacialis]|uniref:Uncharacterized protein n=1 Tax=Polarella glacialis TaxID=89957 RepID=A0A813GM02_POLGL|nr:unnamed protein product [Polarella glacialis]
MEKSRGLQVWPQTDAGKDKDKDDLEHAQISHPDEELNHEAEALKGCVVQPKAPRPTINSTMERILHPDEELDHEAEAFEGCVFTLLMANVVQDFARFAIGTA